MKKHVCSVCGEEILEEYDMCDACEEAEIADEEFNEAKETARRYYEQL